MTERRPTCDGCQKVIRAGQDFLRVEVVAFGNHRVDEPVSLGVDTYHLHNKLSCCKKLAPKPWEAP